MGLNLVLTKTPSFYKCTVERYKPTPSDLTLRFFYQGRSKLRLCLQCPGLSTKSRPRSESASRGQSNTCK